jgi:hypothetical protein
MGYWSVYSNFGVLKIDGKNVKVYKDGSNYTTLCVNEEIVSVNWVGDILNVALKNGKVRRYKDSSNYTTI